MPRIPQIESRSLRSGVGIPFTAPPKLDLGPLENLGKAMIEAENKIKQAEELAEVEQINATVDSTLAREKAILERSPNFDDHPRMAKETIDLLKTSIAEQTKSFSRLNQIKVQRNLNTEALKFELGVSANALKLRKDQLVAGLDKDLDALTQASGSFITIEGLETTNARVQERIETAVSSGVITRDKAGDTLRKTIKNNQRVFLRSMATQSPKEFFVNLSTGIFSKLDKEEIREAASIARAEQKNRESDSQSVEKATKALAFDKLFELASAGKLSKELLDREQRDLRRIDPEQRLRLEELNDRAPLGTQDFKEKLLQLRSEFFANPSTGSASSIIRQVQAINPGTTRERKDQSDLIKEISVFRESLLNQNLRTVDDVIRGIIPTHLIPSFERLNKANRERIVGRVMGTLRATGSRSQAVAEADRLIKELQQDPSGLGLNKEQAEILKKLRKR